MASLLKDRVAIVTGSSRGIGRGIGLAFGEEGAHVVLNGRDVPLLKKLAEELGSHGVEVVRMKGDVRRPAFVRRLILRTVEKFGRIDILVNNVGISPMASIDQITSEAWDAVIETNLKSAFLCSKEVLPHMKRQRSGVILNISSGSAKSGGVGAHYASSKGGLNTLTKSLAFEGASHGIRANAISPGPIETEMADHLFTEERKRFLKSIIPLKRLGLPGDIAQAAVFLCSDEGSYITGETLEIDGGLNFYKPLSYANRRYPRR